MGKIDQIVVTYNTGNNWQLEDPEPSALSFGINEHDLRDILRQFGELPDGVPRLPFTQLSCRLLTSDQFQTLISQRKMQVSDPDWVSRLQKRCTSLAPYVGHFLICIFIRLPGCHYTIEVDPIVRSVVHWEWQTA